MLVALSLVLAPVAVHQEVLPDGSRLFLDPDGEYRLVSPAGEKVIEGELSGGLPDGRWAFRHPDGELWMAGAFRDGLRSGTWKVLDAGGELLARGGYRRGWPEGDWTLWRRAGAAVEVHEFKIETVEHEGVRGSLRDGLPWGRWTFAWDDGSPMLEAWFVDGRLVGDSRAWHRDGTPDGELFDFPGVLDAPPELFVLPELPGIGGAEAEVARRDPAPLPQLLPEGKGELPGREALEAALDGLARPAERPGTFDPLRAAHLWTLRRIGPTSLPWVLNRALARDLTDPEQRRAALALQRAACDLLGTNVTFGVDPLAQDVEPAVLALGLRRAETFFLAVQDDWQHWSFDAHARDAFFKLRPEQLARLAREFPPGWELTPRVEGWLLRSLEIPAPRPRRVRGDEPAREALAASVRWLLQAQGQDGTWAAAQEHHRVGVSALALLVLRGEGSDLSGGPHHDALRRGVLALHGLRRDRDDAWSGAVGAHVGGPTLYDQTLVARLLAELGPGITSRSLTWTAGASVGLLLRARNFRAGWRYDVPPSGQNDSSITAMALLALDAARRGGAEVPAEAFEGGLRVLDDHTDRATGRVGYDDVGTLPARAYENPDYPREGDETLTAASLWLVAQLGVEADAALVERQVQRLLTSLPRFRRSEEVGAKSSFHLYWYYGTQALSRIGGRPWSLWRKAALAAILDSQRQDGELAGSFDPDGPFGFTGGRVYSTAILALTLQRCLAVEG